MRLPILNAANYFYCQRRLLSFNQLILFRVIWTITVGILVKRNITVERDGTIEKDTERDTIMKYRDIVIERNIMEK